MCLLCAVLGVAIAHQAINIFTQIGLVVLVGLASKNAILIVEFAKQLREEGKPSFEATTQACRLRLRPIMMTSFAFILGVVPLVLAEGAGAEMRKALGVAVFSGMLGVTFFGIFLTPVFFHVIQWVGEHGLFSRQLLKWLVYGLLLVVVLAGVYFVFSLGVWGAFERVAEEYHHLHEGFRAWLKATPPRDRIIRIVGFIGIPAVLLLMASRQRRAAARASTTLPQPDSERKEGDS
jgi:predicted RND superfamily exporter protein